MRTRTVRGGFGITVVAGVALLAAAALFDGEPLYVPGLALLLGAAGASGWVLIGTVGTVVERVIGVRRALEDEPVEVVVEARPGITVLPGTALDDPLLPEPLALRPAAGIHRVRIEVRFSRRGRRVLPPPALAVGDPLGLVHGRVHGQGDDVVVLVLPRIEPVVSAARAGDAGRLGRRRATAGAAETELDGLRPHRVGAPASRIFWPAFARAWRCSRAAARRARVRWPRGAARSCGSRRGASSARRAAWPRPARRAACSWSPGGSPAGGRRSRSRGAAATC